MREGAVHVEAPSDDADVVSLAASGGAASLALSGSSGDMSQALNALLLDRMPTSTLAEQHAHGTEVVLIRNHTRSTSVDDTPHVDTAAPERRRSLAQPSDARVAALCASFSAEATAIPALASSLLESRVAERARRRIQMVFYFRF